ncbi:unnamed protein product [Symbiodinium sp. CCMP2456]|nr:unnamed protein product [Symbiodinium sp. CCMP2456]
MHSTSTSQAARRIDNVEMSQAQQKSCALWPLKDLDEDRCGLVLLTFVVGGPAAFPQKGLRSAANEPFGSTLATGPLVVRAHAETMPVPLYRPACLYATWGPADLSYKRPTDFAA